MHGRGLSVEQNVQRDSESEHHETDHDSEMSESEFSSTQGGDGTKKTEGMTRREKLEAWKRQKRAKQGGSSASGGRGRSLLPVSSSQLNSRAPARTPVSTKQNHGRAPGSTKEHVRTERKNTWHAEKTKSVQSKISLVPARSQRDDEKQAAVSSSSAVIDEAANSAPDDQPSAPSEDSGVCFIPDGSSTVSQTSARSMSNESGFRRADPAHEDPGASVASVQPASASNDLEPPGELVEISEESEYEEDMSAADMKFQLFDTTNRLARCTALLQKMVEENGDLRAKAAEVDNLKERISQLESSLWQQQMLYKTALARIPVTSTCEALDKDSNADTAGGNDDSSVHEDTDSTKLPLEEECTVEDAPFPSEDATREASDAMGGICVVRRPSPKRPAGFVSGDGSDAKRSRSDGEESNTQREGGGVEFAAEAEEAPALSRREREQLAAQAGEISALRRSLEAQEANFREERQRILGKLMESEQKRREAMMAMEANDQMWQQLVNNQMRLLQQKVAAGAGAGDGGGEAGAEPEARAGGGEAEEGGAAGRGGEEAPSTTGADPLQQHPREGDGAGPAGLLREVMGASSAAAPEPIAEEPEDEPEDDK